MWVYVTIQSASMMRALLFKKPKTRKRRREATKTPPKSTNHLNKLTQTTINTTKTQNNNYVRESCSKHEPKKANENINTVTNYYSRNRSDPLCLEAKEPIGDTLRSQNSL